MRKYILLLLLCMAIIIISALIAKTVNENPHPGEPITSNPQSAFPAYAPAIFYGSVENQEPTLSPSEARISAHSDLPAVDTRTDDSVVPTNRAVEDPNLPSTSSISIVTSTPSQISNDDVSLPNLASLLPSRASPLLITQSQTSSIRPISEHPTTNTTGRPTTDRSPNRTSYSPSSITLAPFNASISTPSSTVSLTISPTSRLSPSEENWAPSSSPVDALVKSNSKGSKAIYPTKLNALHATVSSTSKWPKRKNSLFSKGDGEKKTNKKHQKSKYDAKNTTEADTPVTFSLVSHFSKNCSKARSISPSDDKHTGVNGYARGNDSTSSKAKCSKNVALYFNKGLRRKKNATVISNKRQVPN